MTNIAARITQSSQREERNGGVVQGQPRIEQPSDERPGRRGVVPVVEADLVEGARIFGSEEGAVVRDETAPPIGGETPKHRLAVLVNGAYRLHRVGPQVANHPRQREVWRGLRLSRNRRLVEPVVPQLRKVLGAELIVKVLAEVGEPPAVELERSCRRHRRLEARSDPARRRSSHGRSARASAR